MRYLPHSIYILSLRGKKSMHGRPLPPRKYSADQLARMFGVDFGLDADKWAEWIKNNRRGLYRRIDAGKNIPE
jgi:hypothetical protein